MFVEADILLTGPYGRKAVAAKKILRVNVEDEDEERGRSLSKIHQRRPGKAKSMSKIKLKRLSDCTLLFLANFSALLPCFLCFVFPRLSPERKKCLSAVEKHFLEARQMPECENFEKFIFRNAKQYIPMQVKFFSRKREKFLRASKKESGSKKNGSGKKTGSKRKNPGSGTNTKNFHV